MSLEAVVRFRFFKSFFVVAFLVNGAALFVFRPLLSFIVAMATLAFIAWCIRCSNCGKSPYILWRGALRIGSAIPERTCSKCGHRHTESPDWAKENPS
jgi:hypothetical protein